MSESTYDQATEIARQVLKETPRDNAVWSQLVRAQLARHDLAAADQAVEEWRLAVRKESSDRQELAGDVAWQQGGAGPAVESWSKAFESNPQNTRLMQKLAQGYHAQHQWAEEDAILSALLEEQSAENYRLRALCRRELHRWSEALEDMHRAEQMSPGDEEVQRSAKLFQRLEKFIEPIRELDARIALTPEDDQLIADRALLFLRSDDPELALRDAEAAGKIATWAVRPRLFQAIALQNLGRTDGATRIGIGRRLPLEALTSETLQTIARLDSEISVERNNAELYISRAWQLNDIGQPTLALEDAHTALEKNPENAAAYVEESYALAKLELAEEAQAAIKRATELDPTFATAWDYRGDLEMARHDYAAAIESFSHSLTLTPAPAKLQKREQAYRQAGLVEKADEDLHTLQALQAPKPQ